MCFKFEIVTILTVAKIFLSVTNENKGKNCLCSCNYQGFKSAILCNVGEFFGTNMLSLLLDSKWWGSF